MDRLKRTAPGFTLLELLIAIALVSVVLLSASNLLINFGKFSSNVVKSETSLMGTALGSFEEIVAKITAANEVIIPATNFSTPSIDIRISPTGSGTSSVHTSDVFHTYWMSAGKIYYKTNTGSVPAAGGGTAIAEDITSLSFARDGALLNRITVIVEAQAASGSTSGNKTKEHLETTAIMRSRSAS